MALEIKVLDIGDIELESSFLVHARDMGKHVRIPTLAYLILGADPILVDTGYSSPEIMGRLGMRGILSREQHLESQLRQYGLKLSDIRYVLHTHLHIDHAGQDDRFPMSTTVICNRRELEYSVSGLMGEQYPAEYITHLVQRLHTRHALKLLDCESSGGEEIIPGVVAVAAGAHTEGSINILVETREGVANICGDVIYDVHDQLIEPHFEILLDEPAMTGNHGCATRAEKAAIKKVLNSARFVCPLHDRPAIVERGKVIGRLHDQVPGPVVSVAGQKRNWFAA